jgi:hypothetical protein
VLVLFAGGLVVLIGIAALVIDLGFSFMIRRQAQNAADPGAIAAARFIPTDSTADMRRAACFYAKSNGFFGGAPALPDDTGCVPANDTDGATLVVNYPPGPGTGTFQGRPGFVEVAITRRHRAFLGRVLGLASINVTSSAVAAFSDGDSNSNSLIALDTGGCGGNPAGGVSGGSQVTITPAIDPSTGVVFDGGYVHVNSSCGSSPTPNNVCDNGVGSGALKIDGNGSVLSAPHVYVHGSCVKSNTNTFNAPLTEGAVQIGDPLADVPAPQPGNYPPGQCGVGGPLTSAATSNGCNFNSAGPVQLQPGTYYGGWRIGNNVQLKLAPGIYIMAGGGITLQAGGSIDSVDSVTGLAAPVLFFSTDNPSATCPSGTSGCQGRLDFTATSTLKVRGIDNGPWKGILMWQDGDGSNPDELVSLGGQANIEIAGTIYAPKAEVNITGGPTASGIASIQIIAWQFDIGGGGILNMPYDPRELYQFEQKGLVR